MLYYRGIRVEPELPSIGIQSNADYLADLGCSQGKPKRGHELILC